jgi:hypothetical protein
MRQALWWNALLVAALGALGLAAHFGPGSRGPADYGLSRLEPGAVASIRLEREGEAPIVIEKKQGAWRITAPLAARADELVVDRLLAIARARTPHRLAATGLERFDLERPRVRLVLDGQEFAFGMVNPVSNEQYVMTEGAVYALHPRYGAALPASAAGLLSRRLLAPGEEPVRIALQSFEVAQREGRWRLVPAAGEPGQDDLNRWVDEWRLAAAARVEPYAGGKPMGTVALELRNGTRLELAILARTPELVLGRPDERLQYHFPGRAAKRLLAPPVSPER